VNRGFIFIVSGSFDTIRLLQDCDYVSDAVVRDSVHSRRPSGLVRPPRSRPGKSNQRRPPLGIEVQLKFSLSSQPLPLGYEPVAPGQAPAPQDTPEVARARAEHLAAVQRAVSRTRASAGGRATAPLTLSVPAWSTGYRDSWQDAQQVGNLTSK